MAKEQQFLDTNELEHLYEKIKEKKEKISQYTQEKLLFERDRCLQILNRNIPMCLSQYTKNILQSDDKKKILGQLHRLNIECYWKVFNLEYLEQINNQLSKNK